MKEPSVKASKPVSLFQREINIDGKALFSSLLKATLNLLAARPVDALNELPDAALAVGLGEGPAQLAWRLVERGFQRALATLLQQHFKSEPDPVAAISALDWGKAEIGNLEFELTQTFFAAPASSAIALRLSEAAVLWMSGAGIPDPDAKNLGARIPGHFALGIHEEWRSDPERYAPILDSLQSPFLPAANREIRWSHYRASLYAAVDEPVFDESFSLRQIYVPCRAYFNLHRLHAQRREPATPDVAAYERKDQRKQRVVWLADSIVEWIAARDSKSPIRLISGGPGTGKSSFAKMLSARLTLDDSFDVLYVPLHLIDVNNGLYSAIGDFFVTSELFNENPLEHASAARPIVLFLDGLDELQMQGKALQDAADRLVQDAMRLADKMNVSACRILMIITGRELAVQAAETPFRNEGEVLHIIPYFEPTSAESYWDDPLDIIALDQRDDWWKRYGELTGEKYDGIPKELKNGEVGDVTAQPLLNYLVALSYRRNGIRIDHNTNINSVYADLLNAVYERGWARNPHPAVQGIQSDHFVRVLEEVALSVWHGAGRTTTLREVEEHCRESKIGALVPGFQEGAASGVSNLLLAFYFRQKGRREDGDKTFEFTHKTFAEYLISRRIVRAFDQAVRKFAAHERDPDEGWDAAEVMYRWLQVCGKSPLDAYVQAFIRREMAERGLSNAKTLQEAGARLFNATLVHSWPAHRFPALNFNEQTQWVRNAWETLVVCLNATARVTEKTTKVAWPSDTSAGELVKFLQGQRNGPVNRPIMSSLSRFNFQHACFDLADLYAADLSGSDLRHCALHYANLTMANLTSADFRGAYFLRTWIEHATLEGARFSKSLTTDDASLSNLVLETAPSSRRRSAADNRRLQDLRSRGAILPE